MNKKMMIFAGIAIVVIAVLVVVLGSNKSSAPTKPQETTKPTTNETNEKANVTITYTDNGFEPSSVTVKAGEVVKVVNNSSSSLQFSSDDHPTHTHDPELNQSVQASGESVTFTLERPGEWGFHDHLNSRHTGIITVK